MTLQINKEPFERISEIVTSCLCLTPITLILLIPVFWFTGHELMTYFSIAQATCFPVFSYGWLKTYNEKYHWVSWKSSQQSLESGSGKQ